MCLYAEERGRQSINGTQMGPSSLVLLQHDAPLTPNEDGRWDRGEGQKIESRRAQGYNTSILREWRRDEWEWNYSRGEREREGAIKLEWENLDGGEKGSEEREAHMSDSNREREKERAIATAQWPTETDE